MTVDDDDLRRSFWSFFLLEGARGLKSIVSPCISTTADIQIVKYLKILLIHIYR